MSTIDGAALVHDRRRYRRGSAGCQSFRTRSHQFGWLLCDGSARFRAQTWTSASASTSAAGLVFVLETHIGTENNVGVETYTLKAINATTGVVVSSQLVLDEPSTGDGSNVTPLAIDSINHFIYYGLETTDPSTDGIYRVSYNPANGAIGSTPQLVSANRRRVAPPTARRSTSRSMSPTTSCITSTNDEGNLSPATNGIYSINVNGPSTQTPVLIAQLPTNYSNGFVSALGLRLREKYHLLHHQRLQYALS